MKDLIGKKVKGFKFEDRKYGGLIYHLAIMDKYIGEVGEITKYFSEGFYRVQFKDYYYSYPADLIEQHLVEEWEIGKEYEFSDGGEWEKGKLLGIVDHEYKYIVFIKGYDFPYSRLKIRHIEPQVKEVTIKEARKIVAEKLGVSVDSIKIKK